MSDTNEKMSPPTRMVTMLHATAQAGRTPILDCFKADKTNREFVALGRRPQGDRWPGGLAALRWRDHCLFVFMNTAFFLPLALVSLAGLSGAALSNGIAAHLIDCAPGFGAQRWSAPGAAGQPQSIHNSITTSICLDIANRNTSDGALLQAWHCNDGPDAYNQHFEFGADGLLRSTSRMLAKCVTAAGTCTWVYSGVQCS